MSEQPFRILPRITDANAHFWHCGAEGELHILRCGACGLYVHPPTSRCPECLEAKLSPEAVSGLGTVHTFTLNHQEWVPAPDHPYAIAVVELDEQPGLRIMTNIVHCRSEEVAIGMRVRVVFEQHGDVYFPLFEPVEVAKS